MRTGRPPKWTKEQLTEQKKLWYKRYYYKKKAQKLCPSCMEGEVTKYVRCTKCRKRQSKATKQWDQKRKSAETAKVQES